MTLMVLDTDRAVHQLISGYFDNPFDFISQSSSHFPSNTAAMNLQHVKRESSLYLCRNSLDNLLSLRRVRCLPFHGLNSRSESLPSAVVWVHCSAASRTVYKGQSPHCGSMRKVAISSGVRSRLSPQNIFLALFRS